MERYSDALAIVPAKISPDHNIKEYWYDLAWAHYNLNHFPEAAQMFEKVLSFVPNDSCINFYTGHSYFCAHDYEKALLHFLKVQSTDSTYLHVPFHIIDCYVKLKQYEEALRHIPITIDPKYDKEDYWYDLAWAHYKLQHYPDAVKTFEKVFSFCSDNWYYHFLMGHSCFFTKEFEKSILHLNKALSLNPKYEDSWKLLGLTYYTYNHFVDAIPAFQKRVEMVPNDHDSCYFLADALFKTNDYPAAKCASQKVLALNPNSRQCWNLLGMVSFELKQYSESKGYFERALKLSPNYQPALDNLSRLKNFLNSKEAEDNGWS